MINLANRRNNIIIFVALCGSMLLFKAAHLQLLDVKYKEKAKKAALYKNVLYPSRGMVMDRNEKLLVTNAPLYDLNVIYRNIDPKMDTESLYFAGHRQNFYQKPGKDWKIPLYHKSVPFPFY
jgi:penicillin-binding protein 2